MGSEKFEKLMARLTLLSNPDQSIALHYICGYYCANEEFLGILEIAIERREKDNSTKRL